VTEECSRATISFTIADASWQGMRHERPSHSLGIDNRSSGTEASETETGERAPSRASIEFLSDHVIENEQSMCVPIAVSELSLADLIGHPRLRERVEQRDG